MKNVNLLSFLDQRTKEMENNVALGTRTNLGWAELTYKGLSILSRKLILIFVINYSPKSFIKFGINTNF